MTQLLNTSPAGAASSCRKKTIQNPTEYQTIFLTMYITSSTIYLILVFLIVQNHAYITIFILLLSLSYYLLTTMCFLTINYLKVPGHRPRFRCSGAYVNPIRSQTQSEIAFNLHTKQKATASKRKGHNKIKILSANYFFFFT